MIPRKNPFFSLFASKGADSLRPVNKVSLLGIALFSLAYPQERWEAFRPIYRSAPLPTAEKPTQGDPAPIQILWRTSPSVQSLYDKVLATLRNATTLSGYRVQLATTPSRQIADSLRFYLLENFPDLGVYLLYETPTYKLRVGDFLDRREAEAWIERYGRLFPGAFVVPDKVLRP
jgi:hypothetical protein